MDLHVRHAQLAQPLRQLGEGVPEAVAETVDEGRQGVDGQAGLRQLRRLEGEVQGGQLEQAEGVVGHHHLGRGAGQLVAQPVHLGAHLLLGERGLGVADRAATVPPPPPPAPSAGRHGRPPAGGASVGGGSRRIGRSPPGVQSVLIALPYVENRIREAGF